MSRLASLYEQGIGTEVDPAKAFYWYTKAADFGSADAALIVAGCYELGRFRPHDEGYAFMEPNEEQALQWYIRAAEMGSWGASSMLAHTYRRGLLGQAVDRKKADEYELKARKAHETELARIASIAGSSPPATHKADE